MKKNLKFKWEKRSDRENLRISFTGGSLTSRLYITPPLMKCKPEWFLNGRIIVPKGKRNLDTSFLQFETHFNTINGLLCKFVANYNINSNELTANGLILQLKKNFGSDDLNKQNNINSFSVVSDEYFKSLKYKPSQIRSTGTVSISHLENTQSALKTAKEYFGDMSIENIKYVNLEAFVTHMTKSGKGNSTIKARLSTIKRMLLWSQEVGLIDSLPKFPIVKVKVDAGFAFTLEEIKNIRDYGIKNYENGSPEQIVWARFLIQCYSGCRYSDLDDILLDQNIRVDSNNNRYISFIQKKVERESIVLWHFDFDWLFPIARKKKYNNAWTNKILKKIAGSWDIPSTKKKPNTHDARRTFVSHCLKSGIQLTSLMVLSGHSTLQTIQKYHKYIGIEALGSRLNPFITKEQNENQGRTNSSVTKLEGIEKLTQDYNNLFLTTKDDLEVNFERFSNMKPDQTLVKIEKIRKDLAKYISGNDIPL